EHGSESPTGRPAGAVRYHGMGCGQDPERPRTTQNDPERPRTTQEAPGKKEQKPTRPPERELQYDRRAQPFSNHQPLGLRANVRLQLSPSACVLVMCLPGAGRKA